MAIAVVGMSAVTASGAWQAGAGIANDRATGENDREVTFVKRGAGDGYGWRHDARPQIGFVNFADSLHGVQIGGLNFNRSGITFPILNIGW